MSRFTCPLASVSNLPVPRKALFWASLFGVAWMLGWDAAGASAQVLGPCRGLAEPIFQVLPTQNSCAFVPDEQEPDEVPTLSPGRAFLYSALIPGLGQRRQGKGRWLIYLAVEGASWITLGHARWSATDLRGQYRNLAWEVGRQFNGTRVDGDFPYYEAMEKFERSGAFDTDPGTPGVQPQMDMATYNGRAWSLATEIHFPPGANLLPGDPEYEAALADYEARAYDERFEWSWVGHSAAWTDYVDLIDSSDGYFRRASQFLGVVIANHLLSGIDAFVTARIQSSGRNQTEAQIRVVPLHDRRGIGVVLQVRH